MTPDVAEVLTRVSEEVGVQIDLLDREGVRYAQLCAETVLSPRWRGNLPPKPPGMQTRAAEMIRELTLDELVAMRRA